jgi:hypothetical protein
MNRLGNLEYQAALLNTAIRRVVADASKNGRLIRSGPEAARLVRDYPGCGLSEAEVMDVLVRTAWAAGVATELCPLE